MPIAVQCSGCGGKFRATDEAAGKRVKCPKCSTIISVGCVQQTPALLSATQSTQIGPGLLDALSQTLEAVADQQTAAGQMDWTLMAKILGRNLVEAAKGVGKYADLKDQKPVLLDELVLQVASVAEQLGEGKSWRGEKKRRISRRLCAGSMWGIVFG
jgi:hypothetical protein